jgi:nitrogen regulatory protein P-II 2
MKLVQFKLLTIICEPVLSSQILGLSEELGATGFTVMEVKGQGSGEKSSGEIPDLKIKIEIVVDLELAKKLMAALAKAYFKNYSVIAYATDVSVIRPEKFESSKP